MSKKNEDEEDLNEKLIGVAPISNKITKKMSFQLEQNTCKI